MHEVCERSESNGAAVMYNSNRVGTYRQPLHCDGVLSVQIVVFIVEFPFKPNQIRRRKEIEPRL